MPAVPCARHPVRRISRGPLRRDFLELDAAAAAPATRRGAVSRLTEVDVDAVRLFLSGGSVVDWAAIAFRCTADVDRYLRTLLLDLDDPVDQRRLRYVFNEAVSYLEEHLHLKFPPALRAPADVRDVFLLASERSGFRRTQILACVILKLMHVIHHMEAADLRHRTPISEAELIRLAHAHVAAKVRELSDSGLPVTAFYGSPKSRASVITKLLAKAENVAATVFDKMRFRIVVPSPDDLVPTVAWMTREMFPFNYVIPRESHNNLVDEVALARYSPEAALAPQDDVPLTQLSAKNAHSGSSYRMINSVVDYPVRLPARVRNEAHLGRVVFLLTEFQVVDEATARDNEGGENAHHLYKARQVRTVQRRLRRGGAG